MKGDQLALAVQLPQTPCFDNFFAGPNAEIVLALRAGFETGAVPAIWLYGAAGAGKSHLLQAAILHAGADALYAPLRTMRLPDEGPFDAFADVPLLALDDVETAASHQGMALHLLRLIDQRRLRRLPMLLSAEAAPSRIPVATPDLRTRFSGMALLGLKPLRESDRRELLHLHAQARGLDLADETMAWLLAHLRRDPSTLIAALERLDQATLSAKRRPTLLFVQQALSSFASPSHAPTSERTSSG